MTNSSKLMSRSRTVLLWAGTLIAGGAIALGGVGKFTGHFWQPLFVAWGYPVWFTYAIGAVEVIAGVCFFIEPVALHAGVVLAIIMLGATYTLAAHPTPRIGSVARPLAYFVIIVVVVVLRRTSRRKIYQFNP